MIALTLALFSVPALAASSGCTPCGTYDSAFGPDDGYSYACFSLVQNGHALRGFRFESRESCETARATQPACAGQPARAVGTDPCWKL